MKTLITITLILFFGSTSLVSAQTSEDAAKKYGVTFPIAELGSCGSKSECRSFCEDPINRGACIDYASAKGFYKVDEVKKLQESALGDAKSELGCDSKQSCAQFCAVEENWEKCGEFAKKRKLSGGFVSDPQKSETINKAQEFLGCASHESCKDFCLKEENQSKCSEFAKTVGLRGGQERKGPGGCLSDSTCKLYCQDPVNKQECAKFGYRVPLIEIFKSESSQPQSSRREENSGLPKDYSPTTFPGKGESKEIFCVRSGCNFVNNSCSCKTATPTPTVTPAPSSGGVPGNASLVGSDGTWCSDPLNGKDGNTRMHQVYSCQDQNGTHSSYCEGGTNRSWYCTGSWNGSSWSGVKCEAGGYTCSGSWGNACEGGICVFSSGGSTPTSTPAPTQIPPTPTPGNVGIGSSVQGVSAIRSVIDKIADFLQRMPL